MNSEKVCISQTDAILCIYALMGNISQKHKFLREISIEDEFQRPIYEAAISERIETLVNIRRDMMGPLEHLDSQMKEFFKAFFIAFHRNQWKDGGRVQLAHELFHNWITDFEKA